MKSFCFNHSLQSCRHRQHCFFHKFVVQFFPLFFDYLFQCGEILGSPLVNPFCHRPPNVFDGVQVGRVPRPQGGGDEMGHVFCQPLLRQLGFVRRRPILLEGPVGTVSKQPPGDPGCGPCSLPSFYPGHRWFQKKVDVTKGIEFYLGW